MDDEQELLYRITRHDVLTLTDLGIAPDLEDIDFVERKETPQLFTSVHEIDPQHMAFLQTRQTYASKALRLLRASREMEALNQCMVDTAYVHALSCILYGSIDITEHAERFLNDEIERWKDRRWVPGASRNVTRLDVELLAEYLCKYSQNAPG